MRSGRVVQAGTVEQVWQRPVDAEAALFLGYASVLEGAAAARVLAAGGVQAEAGTLALRRSALRAGHGPLEGTVTAARAAPDAVRLSVDVDGLGPLHAVAAGREAPRVGERVRLSVDLSRTARIGGPDSVGAGA
jgi:thiamine transport system ATP-binding protein